MLNKILGWILIVLVSIALIAGGSYIVFKGMTKGEELLSEALAKRSGQNNPSTVTPSQGVPDNGNQNSLPGDKTPEAAASDEAKRQEFNSKLDTIMAYIDYYFYEEVDDSKIYDAMLHAALNALGDRYSVYYSPEEFDLLLESSSGSYSGLGVTVSQNVETGQILIVKPFIGSPAMEAGLLPGDEIVGVSGMSTAGMDLTEVVSYMKGPEGTQVTLTILRDGETFDTVVSRARITVQYVVKQMLEDNIGYIMVSEFEETTDEQFIEAIDDLLAEGMKGLIIDMRDNPGGIVDTAINMLQRITPKDSLLVYTEDKFGQKVYYYSQTEDELDIPIVVLMNGNSASSSEIFAGAVQDLGVGKILGTQSYGKGIVQSVIPIMQDYSGIKVTNSRYFTPKGVCIHGIGITPDKIVELDEDLKKTLIEKRDHDNQIDAARELLKSMQ